MKKVLLLNFDVGSGVEYFGNVISKILQGRPDIDLVEIKRQDHWAFITNDIIEINPDVIILNDLFERYVVCSYMYKLFKPETKVICFSHTWKNLFISKNFNTLNHYEKDFLVLKQHLFKFCDKIFILNCMPQAAIEKNVYKNVINTYFPVDDDLYKIKVNWYDRKKNFLYLGSIIPSKFSELFIDLISETNLSIDCYGFLHTNIPEYEEKNREYITKFTSCKNLKYKGIIPQEDIPDLLNEYKFLVLPHNGEEIFNISLLQAIKCGTIPLVSNDRTTNKFDFGWIDWAQGLYYGCNKEEELISNLKEHQFNGIEKGDEISKLISERASEKFSYSRFKEIFDLTMDKFLLEETKK